MADKRKRCVSCGVRGRIMVESKRSPGCFFCKLHANPYNLSCEVVDCEGKPV